MTYYELTSFSILCTIVFTTFKRSVLQLKTEGKKLKEKWKRNFKTGAALVFALSLTLGGPLQSMTVQAAETPDTKEPVTADIYPKPQSVDYISTEGMKFDGTVDLVVHGSQNEVTVPKLKKILEDEGISCQESSEISEDRATILVTTDENDYTAYEGNQALLEEQGYILSATDDENIKGQVTIIGADEDGAYYGVLTLGQMLDQGSADGSFAEATISDYPNIKLRGFVEGFYGFTWSFQERLNLIKDASQFKMNTYIYAPKDDPYHKDQWRTLYPDDKAEEIRQLVEESKKDNVSFCWSAHPGYGFNYNTDADYNALIAKFEQMYSLGVRQFGISYDDLSGYVSGTNHANIINRVNREFVQVKGDVKPLIVVATRYCNAWGSSMSTYFKPFMQTLDEDVVVMWTGADTMSSITKAAYEWPKQQTGVDRDLAAWWNYPVNDYCEGNLMMSPLEILDTDVDNLSGFFLNPMCQAEASKVAIFSGADYSWNVGVFETMKSWKRAIQELVPEANEAFERFADNLSFIKSGESFAFDESRYLVDKLNALTDALGSGEGILEAAAALKSEFETIRNDVTCLKEINNAGLLEEITTFLDAYDTLAQAGIASMDAFAAACDGDIHKTQENISLLNAKLAETETYMIAYMARNGSTQYKVAQVGAKRIKPMLRDSVSQIQALLSKTVSPEVSCSVFTDQEILSDKEVVFNGGFYTVSDLNVVLNTDGYVGFNLPKALKLSEICVETPQKDSLKIQYSLNGIEWTDAETTADETTLKTTSPVAATYVRAVNTGDTALDVQISTFRASVIYSIGTVTATTDLGTYSSYRISNAVDGRMSTKYYSDSGTSAGSYVRVDLQKAIPLYDLKICYAPNPKGLQEGVDGFKATKLEVSTDAVTWTTIGDIIPYTDYVIETIDGQTVASVSYNAEGTMARYIRFSAAESYDNWIQVYEVLYNKSVSNIGDDKVTLADATFQVNNIENLYDCDLTTSATANNISEGDSLSMQMTAITNVGKLTIVQDAASLCGASVSIKKTNGRWAKVGTLDQQVNSFDINKKITAVKLTFDGTVSSMNISEIFVDQNPNGDGEETDDEKAEAIRAELQKLYDIWSDTDLSGYTPESRKSMEAALMTAKAALENDNQTIKDYNAANLALVKAIGSLEYGVQKLHLETVLAVVDNLMVLENNYEVEDTEELKAAASAGKVIYDDPDASQEEVDAAVYTILDVLAKLSKTADVTSLESLIDAAQELVDSGKYTDSSTAALQEAIDNAKNVLEEPERADDAVTDAYSAIIDAIINLDMKGNKAALCAMIIKANAVLKQADLYVADTLKGLADTLADAKTVYDDPNAQQAEINKAVKLLTEQTAKARLLGDVDADGSITTSDAAYLLRTSAEYSKLSADQKNAADVNGDGTADTRDAALILQYTAEMISTF